MPKSLEVKLDRLRNFLWEGRSDRRKIHPLKWSEVIKSKRDGGLGLDSLESKNWALIAKWWWRSGKKRRHPGERP